MKHMQYPSLLKKACTALILLSISLPSLAADDSQQKVIVFAAASLTNALSEIGLQYDEQYQAKTVFSFASSSTLARQIAQGAPAQIYLSANQKWMDYLVESQSVQQGSRVTLLRNSLVLIAPNTEAKQDIQLNKQWDIKASLNGNRLAVGDPDHVPAGRYAKQALSYLGLWQQAEPLLARGNSVRGALVLVERNESPLGIVYATDAQLSKKVSAIATFPATSHRPIEYPLALVNQQPSPASIAFYQYLQSTQAKAIFEKYGFGVN